MKKTTVVLACLSILPVLAVAQTTPQSEPAPSRWALGLGVGVSDSPYAGEGTKVTPLPLIHFEGERFFFRGLTGGAHLMRGKSFDVDIIASFRTDGIDAKDFGRKELARNGIDRDLLEDRDMGLDMGVAAAWRGTAGQVEFTAKADVTGASKGFELVAEYGYEFELGRGNLTPSVSVSYLSKDMANYYYGTLKKEVARGVVDYKPGAAVIPKLGLTYHHPIGQNWRLTTAVEYKFLPNKITNSPLVEANTNGEASVMLGISRRF